MDKIKVSSVLMELATYLKQSQTDDIGYLLKRINDELKAEEEQKLREKFVSLVRQARCRTDFDFLVTTTDYDLYDIWVLYNLESFSATLTSADVLRKVSYSDITGDVITDVELKDVKNFIRAICVYNTVIHSRNRTDECKDLVEDKGLGIPFSYKHQDSIQFSYLNYRRTNNAIYVPFPIEDLLIFNQNELSQDEYIGTFKDALDLVYKNKFVGTRIKSL